ncbi:MAG: DUF2452 domain-containing protein [Bacteroidia bacterium]|nr:DUF2452 domain-containing protein [Bacteroidia bacterium]
MINPIDKDKVSEAPGLLSYPHTIGSVVVKPEDVGKITSRALSAMHEQTTRQLNQIQKQVELLAMQARAIRERMDISEKIYTARIPFEPFIGHSYHLYVKDGEYVMMMIGPDEWGKKFNPNLEFIATVKLLSDHTWEIESGDINQ